MRAVKRSPLFRIAVLSLAVLLAHTAHAANPHALVPAAPPCVRKVAAAQPDPEKKLTPAIKRNIRYGNRVHFHTAFAGPLAFFGIYATGFRATEASAIIALGQQSVTIRPQRDPFVLRI